LFSLTVLKSYASTLPMHSYINTKRRSDARHVVRSSPKNNAASLYACRPDNIRKQRKSENMLYENLNVTAHKNIHTLRAPNRLRLMAVSFALGLPELSAKISHLGWTKGYCRTSRSCLTCNFAAIDPAMPVAGTGRCEDTGDGCVARC